MGGVSLDGVFTSTGESGIVECFSVRSSGKGAQERLHSRGSTQTVALYSLNTHRSLSEVKGLSGWHIVYERKRERREANVHQGDYSISRAQMEAGK